MPDQAKNSVEPIGGFEIQNLMMRYNVFMPRLYNWCKSLGFESGKIMPSRAFCSDESQGYPIIMIAKHFGTFPFNHGRVGGIVATGRHGPHAAHGKDMVIIQASHVGYDPSTHEFGTYLRPQTVDQVCGPNCGKVFHVLQWYLDEYHFAQQNILLCTYNDEPCIIIDNHLLHEDTDNGLLLHLDKLIERKPDSQRASLKMLSTSRIYKAANTLVQSLGIENFKQAVPQSMGEHLDHDMFYFKRHIPEVIDGAHNLEHNLIRFMPQIVTSPWPILTAAQINTQIEFDSTFRTIVKERAYHGKHVMFISGLNIDISPQAGQLFPLTKFVPWAAYIQEPGGMYITMEQQEVFEALSEQSTENDDQIDLESAIQSMTESTEIEFKL